MATDATGSSASANGGTSRIVISSATGPVAILLEAGPPVGDVVIGESSAGYVGNPCD